MPEHRRRVRWMGYGQTAAAFVALLVAWQLLGLQIPPYLLPTPLATVRELIARAPFLAQHALVTLREIVLGFLLAVAVSVPCGLAVAFSRAVERSVMPVLVFTQLIPKIALAPLFIIWFGFGLFPKVFMTFLLSFFPIVIDAIVGFRSLDQEIVYLTRSMGMSPWQAFVKVRLPHALPNIFAGLRVAITLATVGAIIGEFVGADRGLGYLLLVAGGDLRTALLFATLVVLTGIGLVLYYLMTLLERVAIPWHISRRGPLGAAGGP
ncbi:MAG: ABC transporter permease [Candidatus Rokubacteria bacterium]|nr:ABC transporter permease [Candidatus Rokubacteria bacterium]